MVFIFYRLNLQKTVSSFAVPPPHHDSPSLAAPLPPALLAAKFAFVREDGSTPPPALLYRGPYLVLEWQTKFYCLQ